AIGGFVLLAVVERGHPGVFAGLAVAALLVGVDARVSRRAPVPGAAGAVLVVGLLAAGASPVVVAALVAVATPAVAHALTRSPPWWAVVVAGAAAGACGLLYEAHRSTAIALTAVVLFELLVATPPRLVAWTVPFLCAAASLALAGTLVGAAGALVFVPGIVGVAVGAAHYGALPWGSRVLGPSAARRRFGGAGVLFTGLLAIAAVTAAVAAAIHP